MSQAIRKNQENMRKKETSWPDGYLERDNGFPKVTDWRRYEVTCESEKCECNIYNCLRAANRHANFVPYRRFGPNSNTFAKALLAKCGCKLKEYARNVRDDDDPVGHWEMADYPEAALGWDTKTPDYWGNWKWTQCGECATGGQQK